MPKIHLEPSLGQTILNGASRFLPQPKSRAGNLFKQVMMGVGGAMGVPGSNTIGIDPEYRDLLLLQMQMNQQSQSITLESNLEKTKHDSKMAAIRNVRVN